MMGNFILESTGIQICLYLLFLLFFKGDTFFSYQRVYLLAALLFSFLMPWLSFSELPLAQTVYWSSLEPFEVMRSTSGALSSSVDFSQYPKVVFGLIFLYGGGVLWRLIKIRKTFLWLHMLSKKGYHKHFEGTPVVYTNLEHPPFSALGRVFLPSGYNGESQDQHRLILEHERSHVHLHHAWDVMLLEGLLCLFWFNPMLYFYRSSIKTIHEYQADEAVLQHNDIQLYGQKLIEQSLFAKDLPGMHYFFSSPIKKRIKMMTKKRSHSSAKWKYLTILPAFLGLFAITACESEGDMVDPETSAVEELNLSDSPIYDVDVMASMASCLDSDKEKQSSCSVTAIYQFLADNLRYPQEAIDAEIEGKLLAKFTITKEGTMRDIEIIRSLGYGCDEEVLRVLTLLSAEKKWTPAQKEGKNVSSYLKLPVAFDLN